MRWLVRKNQPSFFLICRVCVHVKRIDRNVAIEQFDELSIGIENGSGGQLHRRKIGQVKELIVAANNLYIRVAVKSVSLDEIPHDGNVLQHAYHVNVHVFK